MLHIILLLASLTSACADEQSLLQQGVGVMTSAEFQRAMDSLDAELAASNGPEMPLIRSLVASVRKSNELTPQVKAKIDDVIALIDQILNGFVSRVGTDDSLLAEVNTQVGNCGTQGDVTTQTTSASDAQHAHEVCRADEEEKTAAVDTECHGVDPFVANLAGKSMFCDHNTWTVQGEVDAYRANSNTHSGPFHVWIGEGHGWFSQRYDELDGFREACSSARTALATAAADCTQKQTDYVTSVCQLNTATATLCSDRASCYNSKVLIHTDTTIPAIKPMADRRAQEAAILRYVKCLLNNMIAEIMDPTQCTITRDSAAEKALIQTTYNVSYPDVDGMTACAQLDPLPGSTAFKNAMDAALTAHDADLDSSFLNSVLSTVVACP